MSAPTTPLQWALAYAAIGWHVFPLLPGTKRPNGHLAPRGHLDATTDTQAITAWWTTAPDSGIGVAMKASRLVAVDIDPRNGGHFDLEWIEHEHGRLITDVMAFTGGGGQHLVFLAPEGDVRLPGKLARGIDLKTDGYIAVEPSIHPSGRPYQWEASSNPLDGNVPSPLPGWIADLAGAAAAAPSGAMAAAPRTHTDAELADLRAALALIPAQERETWVLVGMALHKDIGGALGYELWCQWSQGCPEKFDPQDQLRVWRSFRNKPMGQAVQLGSVFDLAYKHGFKRPKLVADVAPGGDCDPPSGPPPGDEGLMTIPGVLGLAVDWINATARKPQPLFAVQAALALGSTAMGRRWRTNNGNWPAMYFLNVGASGSGKEHAKYATERALEEAGLGRLIGAGRFASEAGVLSSLIDKPAQLAVLDEFGKLLQGTAQPQNFLDRNTLKFLMEVWGRADGVLRPVAYSTAGLSSRQAEDLSRRVVRKPSLTLLAMSTPETLFAGLTTAAVADGFLNRFLVVHSDSGRQVARPVSDVAPPAQLLEWLQEVASVASGEGNLANSAAAHDLEPSPVVVDFDAGAMQVFASFEASMHNRMGELDAENLAEMLTRSTEMAMRLALIVAASCRHHQVLAQDAKWACSYVRHHAERNLAHLRELLSDGPFDQLCKEVLRLVRRAKSNGMTERELNKASRSWRAAPLRNRDDAIKALQRHGELAMAEIVRPNGSGRGRKREAWVDARLLEEAIPPTNADKTPTPASALSGPKIH